MTPPGLVATLNGMLQFGGGGGGGRRRKPLLLPLVVLLATFGLVVGLTVTPVGFLGVLAVPFVFALAGAARGLEEAVEAREDRRRAENTARNAEVPAPDDDGYAPVVSGTLRRHPDRPTSCRPRR